MDNLIAYYYQRGLKDLTIESILTQLNILYLSDKITAGDYTKLEKLIYSEDNENLNLVVSIINSKSENVVLQQKDIQG